MLDSWRYEVEYLDGTTEVLTANIIAENLIAQVDDQGHRHYDWVMYRQNAGLDKPEIGIWLGVSHKVGKLMSYWVLPESGIEMS